MKVSVKIPATTANLGPGFDCFGMALPLYNTVTIEEMVLPGSGVEIVLDGEGSDAQYNIPTDENNIVYKAIELLYNSLGQNPSDLKITISTQIPIARGLGSSASVIVGGLIAANRLLGDPADESALLSIATEIEGHPDNITPAIVGGFTIASQEDDGSIVYTKLNWPENWRVIVCIPDYELETGISRSVLPEAVPMKDAVFNLRRTALFVQAVYEKDAELMKVAMKDKIHQPYREELIPGLKRIFDEVKHFDDVLGVALSGAGPSVIVFSKSGNVDQIKETVSSIWLDYNINSQIEVMKPELKGAEILEA